MFTKASERLYLAFISKMPKRTRAEQDRYNEQRRRNKLKTRQALFTSEYVQAKYFDIYKEATVFYNALNSLYPAKHDLRKTGEFREWKKAVEHQKRVSTFPPLAERTHTESQSPHTESQSPHTESQPPPHTESQPSPRTESQSPHTESQPPPRTESQSPHTESQPPPRTESQSPHTESQPSPRTESQPPHTGTQPPSTPPTPRSPTQYSDRLELLIPLQDYGPHKKRTVTTQTLSIITEQEIEPVTMNDIPEERINEIIEQLRQDPDLSAIFSDVEWQIEFEQLGMDIDIPELNSHEDELFR